MIQKLRAQIRRPARETPVREIAAAMILLAVAVGCGSDRANGPGRRHVPAGAIRTPTDEPAGWSVTYPVSPPAGYGTPTGLAVDPTDDDVWFFAQGPDQRLFHWSRSQRKIADSYRIDDTDRAMAAGEFTPIAIDAAHRVWLGINQTLVVVSPGRADPIREVKLPAVEVAPAGGGLQHPPGGPDFGAHASIDAIATGPGGSIVTSRTFATQLQTVDTSTYAIDTIALPHGTAIASLGAGDLASSPTGNNVAVALYSSDRKPELGQFVDGRWTTASPCGADSVTVADRTIAVAGEGCVATGRLPTMDEPASLSPVSVTGLPEKPAVAVVSGDTVVVTVPGGLVGVTRSTRTPVISLGQVTAGVSFGGGSSADPDRLVPVRPALMRSGSSGTVYFVPANRSEIGLVQHTS